MQCDDLAELLSASAGAGAGAGRELGDRRARRHVESCLRCQAELAQYRRLLRTLHTLRTEILVPAPGLVDDVLARLEEAGERSAMRALLGDRRVAYVGGLAVAGAAGAIVLASRSRRMRLAG